ncbi:MAG: cytochrome c [Thermoanaerobaculia bacterium]|jgi:mono/diheme cytochrome c family protein
MRYLCLTALLMVVACSRPAVDAERGGRLYLFYGCAACHGARGDGLGPGAALSGIKPRDLRDLPAYTKGSSIDQIARTIEIGVGFAGMPAYSDLPLDERRSIAVWIHRIAREKR